MRNIAWKQKALMAAGILALLTVAAANAQTSGRFSVPVPFVAGGQMLPAGEYTVGIDRATQTIRILARDGSIGGLYLPAIPSQRTRTESASGMIVLEKVGDVYTLKGVWARGSQHGLALPATKGEQNLAGAAKRGVVATINHATPASAQ